jgi:ribulose-phosphate 3-epimerase
MGEELAALQAAGVDRIHWDVMDGQFVPNLTFGPDFVAACRAHTTLPFEAHLMVLTPDLLAKRWIDAGCELLMVHPEACSHLHRTLGNIRDLGGQAGVAINPATPVSAIAHVLDLIDQVLVMTVNPGFGGQKYLSSMAGKVAEVRQMCDASGFDIAIEVDGGITASTIGHATAAGANVFVAGSAVFYDPLGYGHACDALRTAAKATQATSAA